MASSTTANINRHIQHQEASPNQFINRNNCFAIDGTSTHRTSALQVVTEALSSTENVPEQTCPGDNQMRLSRIPSSTNNPPAQAFPPLRLSTLVLPSNGEQDDHTLQIQSSNNILHSIHPTFASESTSECPPEETQLASNSPPATHFSSSDSTRTTNGSEPMHYSQALITSASGKTITASDSDVSNGFVKDGKMLPYVFEANEAGVRKRTSKILPVCGVCGKRFVCVTTMKRHLVTHTGEKPFSCKVCGKQYTQKGNLRVHERTHRNDRPFECNICHQKFYRKEPMQKHQWRQHGIVHFKSRPTCSILDQNPPTSPPPNIDQASVPLTMLENNSAGKVSYTSTTTASIVCENESHNNNPPSDPSRTIVTPRLDLLPADNTSQNSPPQQSRFTINYSQPPEAHRSSSSNGRDRSVSPAYKHHRHSLSRTEQQYKKLGQDSSSSVQLRPPQAHSNNVKISNLIENSNCYGQASLDVCVNLSSSACYTSSTSNKSASVVPKVSIETSQSSIEQNINGEFEHAKQNIATSFQLASSSSNAVLKVFERSSNANPNNDLPPLSSREAITVTDNHNVQESRPLPSDLATTSNKNNVVIVIPSLPNAEPPLQNMENDESISSETVNIRCTTTEGILLRNRINGSHEKYEEIEKNQVPKDSELLQHAPLKLKMKFAQAYQKEVQEQREKERQRDEEGSRQLGGTCGGAQHMIIKRLDKMDLGDAESSSIASSLTKQAKYASETGTKDQITEQQQPKEMVECQCKSCGSTFVVHDPYNFRCDNCNMKYTSMPTHLIADPLQCIGCCQVFPHKPALKAHQMSPQTTNSDGAIINASAADSKERPFRCCKCGYGFRQKAHLQKHQWRIHRRRIEPMDQQPIKEAEAFFHAIKSSKALSVKPSVLEQGDTKSSDPDITTVTIQDIINHGVEHSVRSTRPFPFKNTTSSRYFSDVLGLEFEGNNSNASSSQEDIDNEEMDENKTVENGGRYHSENNGIDSVDMIDSNSEGSAEAERYTLSKEKFAESSQPLDLSPMKKEAALDYSSVTQNINTTGMNKIIHSEPSLTNCDASKTVNCQSSTTYPPKINLKLRDFASFNIPTKNQSNSLEVSIVQTPIHKLHPSSISHQLPSSEKLRAESRSLTTSDQMRPFSSTLSPNQAKQREDNPLLNQRPLPTAQISFANAIPTSIVNYDTVSVSLPTVPAWKKARTSSPSGVTYIDQRSIAHAQNRTSLSAANTKSSAAIISTTVISDTPTHRTLPPISNLQKPMSLVRKLLPVAPFCSISSSPASFSSGPRLPTFSPSASTNITVPSTNLVKNIKGTAPLPNVIAKPGNSDFVRDKLLQLTSQNVRTV